MNKFGKVLFGGACFVAGAFFMFKGVREIGDVYFDMPAKPTPKIIFGVVKPVEEVVKAETSES